MNYLRICNQFISDRLTKQDFEGYAEKHHIIPKSFNGTNCKSNLIRLTASDHLFAHLLLARIYKGKMVYALHRMLTHNKYSNKKVRLHYQFVKSNLKVSDEHKSKLRIAQTGKIYDDNARRNISQGLKGRKLSDEHKRKLSLAAKGRKNKIGEFYE